MLALGADLKNRFLFADGQRIHFGPDIGDLGDADNFDRLKKEIKKILARHKPHIIACDLHSGYFSTAFAKDISLKLKAYALKLIQHHHAHIASVIFEHGLKKPAIGVSFDGTGLGADGKIWGGEFFIAHKKDFLRRAHLKYVKMPGGEKAIREPWRMLLSIMGKKGFPYVKSAAKKEKEAILSLMSKDINSPLTSSAGRLFDAAAALIGLTERVRHEAEGPMKLEAICDSGTNAFYEFGSGPEKVAYSIDTGPIFTGMARDLKKNAKKSLISGKFHNSMAKIVIDTVKKLSRESGIKRAALSGGVFQNAVLKKKAIAGLSKKGFRVFTNEKFPVNDFNI